MFSHWLPLVEEAAFLVIGEDRVLHRTPNTSFWESPVAPESEHFWSHFDVREDGAAGLEALDGKRTALISDDSAVARELGFEGERLNPAGLMKALERVRAHKSDYELHCISEANAIASRGHLLLRDLFAQGDRSELELHLEYLRSTGQDALETPYGNIVALGEHAAVLHHVHYDKKPSGAESLLVDAGATYLGYASDITRTWSKGESEAATTFKALIDGIESLQLDAVGEIKPGMNYEELHDNAHLRLAQLLRELDIARMAAEEMVESKVTRTFFPHGLGHSLGIQVHDVGCKERPPSERNPHLRTTADVEVGHVFTIEPGCYFIASLLAGLRNSPTGSTVNWELVEALRPFGGIRIEDNVAITESGTVNLTRDNGSTGL